MVWGVGAALVMFAAVLVWAFATAPNGQLGGTTRPTASPSTGVLANQGAGESQVGKNEAVTPPQSPTVGSGRSSSGEAAEIEQSAKPLQLTDAQRQQICAYFAGDDYLIVGDRLIIVDPNARRVVAIIPNIG